MSNMNGFYFCHTASFLLIFSLLFCCRFFFRRFESRFFFAFDFEWIFYCLIIYMLFFVSFSECKPLFFVSLSLSICLFVVLLVLILVYILNACQMPNIYFLVSSSCCRFFLFPLLCCSVVCFLVVGSRIQRKSNRFSFIFVISIELNNVVLLLCSPTKKRKKVSSPHAHFFLSASFVIVVFSFPLNALNCISIRWFFFRRVSV